MPDQLEAIVQRMIDAGESEEAIASVIQAYPSMQSAPPSEPTDVFHQDLGTSIGQMAIGGVKELGTIASGIGTMLTQSPIKTLEQATAARRELLEKAKTAPSLSERIGYEVTGRIPFVGPMLAQIGEQIGTGDPETMGRAGTNIGLLALSSPKVRAGVRQAGSSTVSAADRAVRGTQRFIEAHPSAQVGAGALVGGLTGGIPGVILGAAGGRPTAALVKLATKALKTQRGTPAASVPKTPSVAEGMSQAGRGRYGDLAAGQRIATGMSESGRAVTPPAPSTPSVTAGMTAAGQGRYAELAASDRVLSGMSAAGRAANPNAGGRLVVESVDDAVRDAVARLSQEQTPTRTLGLSHPEGGGFTTPPSGSGGVNAGGRLIQSAEVPSQGNFNAQLAEALAAIDEASLPFSHPVGGGFTVPPGGVTRATRTRTRAPRPTTAQDALRQELAARDIDWRTTDAVPIDAITRDITRPGGSIIEAGESRIGLGERLAEALKLAETAKTPAAAEAALTEARRLAAAARQRMHIASKTAGGRGR